MYKKFLSIIIPIIIIGALFVLYNYLGIETKALYHDDSTIAREISTYKFNTLIKTETYDTSGRIESRIEYKNGDLHGREMNWHENGQLAFSGIYKNGERHGKVMTWYENGQLESSVSFKNNARNIKGIFYYEDGSLRGKNYQIDGLWTGLQQEWHKNGNLKLEINFEDGLYKRWDWEGGVSDSFIKIKKIFYKGNELYLTTIEGCCKEKTVEFYDILYPSSYLLNGTNLFSIINEVEKELEKQKSKIYVEKKNRKRARDEFLRKERLKRYGQREIPQKK